MLYSMLLREHFFLSAFLRGGYMMFALNDKVVYPGHGVARVNRIIERTVGGCLTHFYELKFVNKEMIILVPLDNLSSVGIRSLNSHNYIQDVFKTLMIPAKKCSGNDFNTSSWNKRSKKYQSCLRSGDLVEISKIYRDLHYLSQEKELSFGERNLLVQTEALLAEEISMVESFDKERAVDQIRACFVQAALLHSKNTESTI